MANRNVLRAISAIGQGRSGFNILGDLGGQLESLQFEQQQARANLRPRINFRSTGQGFQGAAGSVNSGNPSFDRFLAAISGKESGGNYGARNRSSGALGKYQIMPANIPRWSQAALGRRITPEEFLRSPQLQEQIAQNQLKNYYNAYGPQGAASAWYSGSPTKYKSSTRKQRGGYPSIAAYVQDIMRRMG